MQALLGPNGDFFSVTLLLPQTANTPVAYSLANLSWHSAQLLLPGSFNSWLLLPCQVTFFWVWRIEEEGYLESDLY